MPAPETLRAQVLVIGAGPAGAAAANILARFGIQVALADRLDFPRDKICGDALIPDALAALARLGLKAEVLRSARTLDTLRVFAPNGAEVPLRAEFACLPRYTLDAVLRDAAVAHGATFLAPCRLLEPLFHNREVAGARFRHTEQNRTLDIRADATLLATGAAGGPLKAFGVARRTAPSAVAARVYYRLPDHVAAQIPDLCISFHEAICPGYGWIFPGPDNVYNLGVGIFYDARKRPAASDLGELWALFLDRFPLAAAVACKGEQLTPFKGAPLRTRMVGADLHRPGLLVIGEAAGLTYSLSGEGIGKAMESGILAAELLINRFASQTPPSRELGPIYARTLETRYRRRFDGYKAAQNWLSWPSVCNWIARRAISGTYVRPHLEKIIAETEDPDAIFSLQGMLKSAFR